MELPPNVEAIDCGSSGLRVLDALDGASKAIIIDAVKAGGKPGDVYRLGIEEVLEEERKLLKLISLHQFDLIAALRVGQLTSVYKLPKDIVVIGVEPKALEFGLELSDEVKRAIPKAVELILEEVKKAMPFAPRRELERAG